MSLEDSRKIEQPANPEIKEDPQCLKRYAEECINYERVLTILSYYIFKFVYKTVYFYFLPYLILPYTYLTYVPKSE